MSVEAMSLVLNHSRASGTAKLVLIGIANHDGDGGAWPSITTLARYANAGERTVQRAIRELVEMGELRVLVNGGGTQNTRPDRRPNRYQILVRPDMDGVTSTTPRTSDGVTLETERGDIPDANGVTPVSPEPSLEPSMNKNPPQSPRKRGEAGCDKHKARAKHWCSDCMRPAPKPIPTWCGHCDPAGEHSPGQRLIMVTTGDRTKAAKCPTCHPAALLSPAEPFSTSGATA